LLAFLLTDFWFTGSFRLLVLWYSGMLVQPVNPLKKHLTDKQYAP